MFSSDQCECIKSELDLFSSPPLNTSMDKGTWVEFRPIASLTSGGPIEFNVTSADEDYTDVGRTYLHLKVQLQKQVGGADPANIENGDRVAPLNLWMHSLFSQVDIKLNGTLITPSVNTYAYRAYIETLLSYGTDAKDGQLTMEGWSQDQARKMNNTVLEGVDLNQGFKSRHDLIMDGGSKTELLGRLHCDLFQQDRYLPNGVEMTIKLIKTNELFNLIGQAVANTKYKVTIESAVLFVRRVKINPAINLEHNKLLNSGHNAKYPLRRALVNTFTIPTGTLSKVQDNVLQGQIPRRIVLGLVSHEAFNGSLPTNAFNFEHFNTNFLALYVEGESIPSQPYRMNFSEEDGSEYLRSYLSVYEGMGMLHDNRGNCISRKDYPDGFMLHVFDLTADMSEGHHMDPIKHGSVRVEIHFKQALEKTINVLLYCEYENHLQIDRLRSVITDF